MFEVVPGCAMACEFMQGHARSWMSVLECTKACEYV